MIIASFNLKGGVGKTTTAVNVAASLAGHNHRVLLVDLEADMNASISFGVRPMDPRPSIADLLTHRTRPANAIHAVPTIKNLHLITGSPELANMDVTLRNVRQPERRLADVLRPLAPQFDMIVLDCPAAFSLMALSVPMIADQLVVPVRADYLSLESLALLLRWYKERRDARKATAAILGIVLTMVDYRRKATREIVDIIRLHNRRGVFRTEIPDDPRAPEAPSHGVPLVNYIRSQASEAYVRLTTEVVKRIHTRAR